MELEDIVNEATLILVNNPFQPLMKLYKKKKKRLKFEFVKIIYLVDYYNHVIIVVVDIH
jgi:hypothetical protein